MEHRLIYSNNGVLTDLSTAVSSYHVGDSAISFVNTEDAIYIGSSHPFNCIFLKLKVVSSVNLGVSVEYWSGAEWIAPIELFDETNGLMNSGYLTWQINRFKSSWSMDSTQTSSGGTKVTGLGSVNIYDKYWCRIKLATSGTFTLSWIGHQFITDNDLYAEYPEFRSTSLKGAVESGKTTWEEQIVIASRIIIEDLIQRRIIVSQSQILERRKMISMAVARTAELIYTMLGDDYVDQRASASKEYLKRVDGQILFIDTDGNADLSLREEKFRQGFLYQ